MSESLNSSVELFFQTVFTSVYTYSHQQCMRFCESVSLLAFGIARYIALFFLNNFIYFGLAESSWLHRHLSNCSEQGLLFVVVWGLLPAVTSSCGAGAIECVGFGSCGLGVQRLWLRGSSTQAQWLWSMALVAPLHVGSS